MPPLCCLLNVVFNVCGCNTNVEKKYEISKGFLWWKMDVCALSVTKLKEKCRVKFDEVAGRVSCVGRARMRDGVALLLSRWLLQGVVKWKVSSWLMRLRVKIQRDSYEFTSANGPGSEKSEQIKIWNGLNDCVRRLVGMSRW